MPHTIEITCYADLEELIASIVKLVGEISGKEVCQRNADDLRQAAVAIETMVAESAAIPPAPQKVEDFDAWWERDGKFFDPDTDDVPWFDKRKFLAEYAWHRRGARNA